MNIRQRIRKGGGISCLPWRTWRGEIDYLPISAKVLFRRSGMAIDVWEMNLKSEGLLFPDEELLEVLKIESNLYRGPIQDVGDDGNLSFGLVPDDWTEEDYEYNFGDDK
jgi:hypothetical protein